MNMNWDTRMAEERRKAVAVLQGTRSSRACCADQARLYWTPIDKFGGSYVRGLRQPGLQH